MKEFNVKKFMSDVKRERKASQKMKKDFDKKTEKAIDYLKALKSEKLPLTKENSHKIAEAITTKALHHIYSLSGDETIYKILTRQKIHDFEDLSMVACISLLSSINDGLDEDKARENAFKAINATIYDEKKRNYKHIFVEDYTEKGIEIIDTTTEIDNIIAGRDTRQKINKNIAILLSLASPRQKAIIRSIAKGKNLSEIARAQGKDESTIREHFNKFKKVVAARFPDGLISSTGIKYTFNHDKRKPLTRQEINRRNKLPLPISFNVLQKF